MQNQIILPNKKNDDTISLIYYSSLQNKKHDINLSDFIDFRIGKLTVAAFFQKAFNIDITNSLAFPLSTISQVISQPISNLENAHNWIQYAFPLYTKGVANVGFLFNETSQDYILNKTIYDFCLKNNRIDDYHTLVDTYINSITKLMQVAEANTSPNNHNNQRITRAITSSSVLLNKTDFEKVKQIIQTSINKPDQQNKWSQYTRGFWTKAFQDADTQYQQSSDKYVSDEEVAKNNNQTKKTSNVIPKQQILIDVKKEKNSQKIVGDKNTFQKNNKKDFTEQKLKLQKQKTIQIQLYTPVEKNNKNKNNEVIKNDIKINNQPSQNVFLTEKKIQKPKNSNNYNINFQQDNLRDNQIQNTINLLEKSSSKQSIYFNKKQNINQSNNVQSKQDLTQNLFAEHSLTQFIVDDLKQNPSTQTQIKYGNHKYNLKTSQQNIIDGYKGTVFRISFGNCENAKNNQNIASLLNEIKDNIITYQRVKHKSGFAVNNKNCLYLTEEQMTKFINLALNKQDKGQYQQNASQIKLSNLPSQNSNLNNDLLQKSTASNNQQNQLQKQLQNSINKR